jgi:hypothetical protein
MSQVNPIKYDSNLQSDVTSVTNDEIKGLMNGDYDLPRVKTNRISNFIRNKDSVTNQSKLISGGYGDNGHRVNFMIKDVEEVDDKIKLFVKILKAGKMVDRKMIPDSNFRDNPELLDSILYSRFKELDKDITYLKPKNYLPKIGFQLLDIFETKKKKIGDPGGFCALWTIWYVDMRLTYPDIPPQALVTKLIKNIRINNISVKNMIRNYAINVIKNRDEILNSAKLDINNWINDEYTDNYLDIVIEKIKEKISNLRK